MNKKSLTNNGICLFLTFHSRLTPQTRHAINPINHLSCIEFFLNSLKKKLYQRAPDPLCSRVRNKHIFKPLISSHDKPPPLSSSHVIFQPLKK